MRKQILTAFAITIAATAFAQSNFSKNAVYLEAGGTGLFGSLNYERQLTDQPGLGLRAGVGFYAENAFYLTIPVAINYLFKLRGHGAFIDAGLGASWTRVDGRLFSRSKNPNGDHFVNFVPSIGYRKHTANDVMWRVSLTPVANKNGLVPWLGASIGKRF